LPATTGFLAFWLACLGSILNCPTKVFFYRLNSNRTLYKALSACNPASQKSMSDHTDQGKWANKLTADIPLAVTSPASVCVCVCVCVYVCMCCVCVCERERERETVRHETSFAVGQLAAVAPSGRQVSFYLHPPDQPPSLPAVFARDCCCCRKERCGRHECDAGRRD